MPFCITAIFKNTTAELSNGQLVMVASPLPTHGDKGMLRIVGRGLRDRRHRTEAFINDLYDFTILHVDDFMEQKKAVAMQEDGVALFNTLISAQAARQVLLTLRREPYEPEPVRDVFAGRRRINLDD